MIKREDDSLHKRTDDPYWNESAWFGFQIPEHLIHGFVYFWHRPNMNLTAAGVAIWDPSGEHKEDCLYYDFVHYNPLPEDADMFDFKTDNGVSCKLIEPLQSYQLGYDGAGCQLDLVWETNVPVQDLRLSTLPGGVENFAQPNDYGDGHYEVGGKARGTVTIEGETFVVDCYANRDRSWGPRKPMLDWTGGGYECGHASDDHSFAVASIFEPWEVEPVWNSTQKVTYGWYIRDGRLGRLIGGQRRVERGDDGRPIRIITDAEDDLGRTLHVEGENLSLLKFNEAGYFVHWCLMRFEVDGQEAWGEEQEYFRPQAARRLIRTRLDTAAQTR